MSPLVAVPFAVAAALWLERRAVRRRGLVPSSLRAVASNAGCGALRGIAAIGVQGTLIAIYASIHRETALVAFDPKSPLAWLAAFVAYDFVYYWVHRLSHRVPLLWAAHSVHHQATDLDPSVLFRAPVMAPIQVFPLYAPLAVLGIPPAMYVAVAVFEHATMFWLHTRAIDELPWIGRLFNTPAHHRAHHAADAELGCSNYGGVLIVWDRLFGTFRPDPDVRQFGIGQRPAPLGPIRANLAPFVELLEIVRRQRGVRARVRALLLGPSSRRRRRQKPLARNVVHLQPNTVRIFE